MYSKAKIAGHPLHPMLIGFPIALYTATVGALLAYLGTHDVFWYRAALVSNVAALIMAAIALVPGAIDLFSIPAKAEARRTGYIHAGFNLVTFVLFLISAFVIGREWRDPLVAAGTRIPDAMAPLVLSILGMITLLIAGWFGWTLVQTHHVGIVDRPSEVAVGVAAYEEREAYIPPAPARDDRQIPIRH